MARYFVFQLVSYVSKKFALRNPGSLVDDGADGIKAHTSRGRDAVEDLLTCIVTN